MNTDLESKTMTKHDKNVTVLKLSPAEVQVVLEHREKVAKQKRADDFREKVILMAAKTWEWQQKEGIWMGYSDFVNNYGYQEDDANLIYQAIRRVWDAAKLEQGS